MLHQETYRLADSTVVEPLVNSWVAWADLISPAPHSMHLLNYQIRTLSSYLDNPDLHVKASRNPKLIGGPYSDIPLTRQNEVKTFLETTERVQRCNIEFAKAITEAYQYLENEAKGQSLEPYYQKLPETLKGYAELLYDYHNHPILRLIESLLYESPYYNKSIQSLRIFQLARDDSRRFFLNTPRLMNYDEIDWKIPFESPQIDEFFKLECVPQSLGYIGEMLGLDHNQARRLLPMLSTDSHSGADTWDSPSPRIRYLGHACVLVEWSGITVMTDPWLGVMPKGGGLDRMSYREIPQRIDYALITHGHNDHFVMESLLRLRGRIDCLVVPRNFGLFYADVSLKLLARKLGFKNVIELDAMESIKLPDGEIIAAPFLGEHADLAHGKSSYIVRAGNERILFAADSNCLERRFYEQLRNFIGDIQTIFLGMECVGAPLSWLYGALLPAKLQHSHDKTRRTKGSDSHAALEMIDALRGKRVYIYAMGSEPWLQYNMGLGLSEDSIQIKEANRVLQKVREKGCLDARRPYGKLEIHLDQSG